MTRKDYERFTVALKSRRERMLANIGTEEPAAIAYVQGFEMAVVMKQENPRFDAQKFYAAVGMEG